MRELDVPADVIDARLKGLLVSRDGPLIGIAVSLSESGLANRSGTVTEIRNLLKYCELDNEHTLMVGAPLFSSELDRLGGHEANAIYFTITLMICLGLLYYLIRDRKSTRLNSSHVSESRMPSSA